MEFSVGAVSEFADPGRKVIDLNGVEVGVYRVNNEFFAYENFCPHGGGPACQGRIVPLTLEAVDEHKCSSGRIFSKSKMNLACPWHVDIRTGEHALTKRYRLRKVPVQVDGDQVVIRLGS